MKYLFLIIALASSIFCAAQSTANGTNSKTFTVNGVSFNMVLVNGGTYKMGATTEQGSDAWDDEKPTHTVTLSDFSIGQTEVTQALWQAVMGDNPAWELGDLQRPVERVSWDDCQMFIKKLNELTGQHFRLPTEAEWEFAARGGNACRGYKYAGSNDCSLVAWYGSSGSTHPVATKAPNELGLYDMSGNVWEWCQTPYYNYNLGETIPETGKFLIFRGGSTWFSEAWKCRVSFRNLAPSDYKYCNLGLRLAL